MDASYPWEGKIRLQVKPEKPGRFALMLRIPGWARNQAIPGDLYRFESKDTSVFKVLVNGEPAEWNLVSGYAEIRRMWKAGDKVQLELPMPVRRVLADTAIKADRGRIALQRGPLVYCAEWADNYGRTSNLVLPESSLFRISYDANLLRGVETIRSTVPAVRVEKDSLSVQTRLQEFQAIPYYAWANRGKGEMTVWFPFYITHLDLVSF